MDEKKQEQRLSFDEQRTAFEKHYAHKDLSEAERVFLEEFEKKYKEES